MNQRSQPSFINTVPSSETPSMKLRKGCYDIPIRAHFQMDEAEEEEEEEDSNDENFDDDVTSEFLSPKRAKSISAAKKVELMILNYLEFETNVRPVAVGDFLNDVSTLAFKHVEL